MMSNFEVDDILKLLNEKDEDFSYFNIDDKIRIARSVSQTIAELILQQTRYNKLENSIDDLEHSINRKQEEY